MTDAPERRKRIPAEAWRQEKARVFARNAITCDHEFIAHDRSEARGDRSHLFEWKRGVKSSLPDTQTIIFVRNERPLHVWFEWKSRGKEPTTGQYAALERMAVLGDWAGWGDTIDRYGAFLTAAGVPLATNWRHLAMVYDGMVDSRIAKAVTARDGRAVPKKSRNRKVIPRRNLAPKRIARAMHEKGFL
jgi:hypothetical protein